MRSIRRTTKIAVAAAACLAAIGSGSASASTLSVSRGAVTYTGAPAEANHLTVSYALMWGTYVFEDTGATISVTSPTNQGCHPYTATMAYCDFGSVSSISAKLGNGGGFAQSKLSLTPVTFTGGAGNDTLIGGGGADTLIGTGGKDTLTAGNGSTHLIALSGDVTMTGGSGHNTYQGGPGNDTIRTRNGVTEDVTCGAGTDSVTADPADTTTADCETVDRGAAPAPPAGTTPADGSQTATVPGFQPPLPAISTAAVTVAANKVPIGVTCPATVTNGCSGTIDLSLVAGLQPNGRVMAARRVKRTISNPKRFRVKAGRKVVVRVSLSRRGARKFRRAVRVHKSLKVLVTVAMDSSMGTQKTTRTITVRAERRSRGSQKKARKR
jgi:hypothetical protein